jgi:hypothetical protein
MSTKTITRANVQDPRRKTKALIHGENVSEDF